MHASHTSKQGDSLDRLLEEISACRHCAAHLPLGPRPVLQVHQDARLRIAGQAPGRKVHQSGIPWNDASGERLRDWLGLTPAQFYDASRVALVPVGFCYPGKALSGDLPPRPECARLWSARLDAHLRDVSLTLLVGSHAQAHHLGDRRKATLTETVRSWKAYLPLGYLPLPHPSPRNQLWVARNPWFKADVLPAARAAIQSLGLFPGD
jgi:uracil-DNA glycosylase